MATTNGSSCVSSLRLAPVRMTASGMPVLAPRHRRYLLYLRTQNLLLEFTGKAVHQIAPEQRLTELIEFLQPSSYIKGDLNPSAPRTQRVDIDTTPFDRNHFDWAICNHVLEYVIDPHRVLAELYRIIKPGGRLLCQTPYAEKLKDTFESPLLTSGGERLFYYGQEDRLRLFGRNIAMIIRAAGFEGELVKHSVLLPDIVPLRYGVNEFEPFFLFRKPFH